MKPYFSDDTVTLYAGDCRDALPNLPDASVDAVVTDPPYELGFMGRAWDASGIAYDVDMWRQCLRVLRPGGHLLAFGGTRTYHRLTVAIEDAGFEIRDSLHWIYGSGFPKSLDVSKAIDKRPGVALHRAFAGHLAARREVAGLSRADVSERVVGSRSGACWNWEHHQFPEAKWWPALRDLLDLDDKWGLVIAEADREVIGQGASGAATVAYARPTSGDYDVTAPATDDARRWQGWGTALKPAHEPIVLARKPLAGTVAATVLAHGTGGLNIDGCRTPGTAQPFGNGTARTGGIMGASEPRGAWTPTASGRWPANVLLSHPPAVDGAGAVVGDACAGGCVDGCPVAEMEAQSGVTKSTPGVRRNQYAAVSAYSSGRPRDRVVEHDDSGGASRFFPVFRYEAKAPASERPRGDDGTAHATVKPLGLLRWLIRLVTPPGGLVLDPFLGSGTTAEACVIEGFRCIGVERDESHLPLIKARLAKPIQPALGFEDAS